ncbi:MAG: ABC transporter permease, partial [Candidatus Cryptobacteroides sp.]
MELLDEIWNSLGRNKLRTALTGFAVSWGLLMIIALLGAGNGLMNALTSNMDVSLANIMTVYPGRRSLPYDGMKAQSQIRMDVSDVDFTASNFQDVIDDVTAWISYGSMISYGQESMNAT